MPMSFPVLNRNSGGNTLVHVTAAPQLILLYMFLCVLPALKRRQNTQKHVLQLSVAEGDPSARNYALTV